MTLVTGAAGFIGFHLAAHLLARREHVIGVFFFGLTELANQLTTLLVNKIYVNDPLSVTCKASKH